MSVLVRFGKQKAILRAGKWFAANPKLERRLNTETARWIRDTGGPAINSADQEKGVAREMAARLKGSVLIHVRSRNRSSAEAFLAQRQLVFDFNAEFSTAPDRVPAPAPHSL